MSTSGNFRLLTEDGDFLISEDIDFDFLIAENAGVSDSPFATPRRRFKRVFTESRNTVAPLL